MKKVLTEIDISSKNIPKDVEIKIIKQKEINKYNGDDNVVAVVGSRATAKTVATLNLPNLALFQLTSAGYDGVPIDKFSERNVAVCKAENIYSVPIGETVVFGMLTMAKKLRKNPNNRHPKIQRHYSEITELKDKKVIILGAGSIGYEVAKRLVGFEMIVDGFARTKKEEFPFRKMYRTREEILDVLGEYDYIVSALPDSDSTRKLIDGELLGKFKNTSVFVNVGRRAVIDENALFLSLKKRQIGGAVLDMFEIFPNCIQNKFRRLKNTVVLPGVAAVSAECTERLREMVCENISSVLVGEKVKYKINEV